MATALIRWRRVLALLFLRRVVFGFSFIMIIKTLKHENMKTKFQFLFSCFNVLVF